MKKVVFKALLLIIVFTNVAMAWSPCNDNEIKCRLESSDNIGDGGRICVYRVGDSYSSNYTVSVPYKSKSYSSCPDTACYNPETGKVRFP